MEEMIHPFCMNKIILMNDFGALICISFCVFGKVNDIMRFNQKLKDISLLFQVKRA